MREKPEIEKLRYEILLKISFGDNTESEVLIGHLDDFIKRNEELVKEMNECMENLSQLKSDGFDCTYSCLTALCGVHVYSAMKDWAVEAKKIIIEKGES